MNREPSFYPSMMRDSPEVGEASAQAPAIRQLELTEFLGQRHLHRHNWIRKQNHKMSPYTLGVILVFAAIQIAVITSMIFS